MATTDIKRARLACKVDTTWCCYQIVDGKKTYLGTVKAPDGHRALRRAHKKYGDAALDVVGACYIQDRKLGTMKGTK